MFGALAPLHVWDLWTRLASFHPPILHFLSRHLSLSSPVYLGLLSNRPALRLQQNEKGNICLISSMFCLTPEWLFYFDERRLWLSRTIALRPAPGENGRVYFCCSFSSQGLKFGFYWLVCVKLCFSVCISAFRLITECNFFLVAVILTVFHWLWFVVCCQSINMLLIVYSEQHQINIFIWTKD